MDMNWQPFIISLELAVITAICLLLLATPVAYGLAFFRFRGRPLVEAFFAMPLVLPPTVLGFFVLVAIGGNSPVGEWWQKISGNTLAFSFTGIVIASILYSFPFAVQPIQNAFERVDRNLIDTARTLGCTEFKCFLRVIIPSSSRGLVSGAILSFAHTVGEFGVVLMVGGSIPGKTKVASIAIYEQVEMLEYREAAVMSLLMLIFSFAILSLVYYFNRRSGVGRVAR